MSKYHLLWEFLKKKNQEIYQLTFAEIQDILGFPIDHSFLTYKKEAKLYGYEVDKISLKEKKIQFKKMR